jgi:hypothetical protein
MVIIICCIVSCLWRFQFLGKISCDINVQVANSWLLKSECFRISIEINFSLSINSKSEWVQKKKIDHNNDFKSDKYKGFKTNCYTSHFIAILSQNIVLYSYFIQSFLIVGGCVYVTFLVIGGRGVEGWIAISPRQRSTCITTAKV